MTMTYRDINATQMEELLGIWRSLRSGDLEGRLWAAARCFQATWRDYSVQHVYDVLARRVAIDGGGYRWQSVGDARARH